VPHRRMARFTVESYLPGRVADPADFERPKGFRSCMLRGGTRARTLQLECLRPLRFGMHGSGGLVDMPELHAQAADDEGEFADLRQVDGRHGCEAGARLPCAATFWRLAPED